MNILLILLLVLVLLILLYLCKKYKNPRLDYLNGVSGQVGGGKTSSVVCRVISLLRRIYFIKKSKKIKNDYIILSSFPMGKEEKKTGKRYIRIWFKKIYCYDFSVDILTLQERLPQNEVIIIIDEFSNIASSLDFNNPIVKDNIKEFARNFRHYTEGMGYFWWIDQASNEIFNPVRRRTAYCYNMVSTKKFLLLPIIVYEFRKILISDEVENFVEVEKGTDETDLKKFIFFVNPFKYYDSVCYSERYKAITKIHKLRTSPTLKRNDVLKLPKQKALYYETLIFDGITAETYYKETLSKKDFDNIINIEKEKR